MNKIKAFFIGRSPSATINAIRAYDDVLWKVDQLGPKAPIAQAKGNILEYLTNVKHNIARGQRGLGYENVLTDAPAERGGYGNPQAPDDIRINGRSYQCKVHNDIHDYLRDLKNPKYKRFGITVPSDHYRPLQEELFSQYQKGLLPRREYLRLSNRVFKLQTPSQELAAYGNQNGYLDMEKARLEARRSINQVFLQEWKKTTIATTISHTIIGGVSSSIKNVKKYLDGDIEREECIKNILKDTGKSAGKGAAIGVLTGVFQSIGHGSILLHGPVSLTLAHGVFDLGAAYYQFLKGEIDLRNFGEQIVTKSIIAAVSLVASVSLLRNPILEVIVGCVVSSITNEIMKGRKQCVCQGQASLFDAELANQIRTENERILGSLEARLKEQSASYNEARNYLELMAESNNIDDVRYGLQQVASALNLDIQFESFGEFQDAMRTNKTIEV